MNKLQTESQRVFLATPIAQAILQLRKALFDETIKYLREHNNELDPIANIKESYDECDIFKLCDEINDQLFNNVKLFQHLKRYFIEQFTDEFETDIINNADLYAFNAYVTIQNEYNVNSLYQDTYENFFAIFDSDFIDMCIDGFEAR